MTPVATELALLTEHANGKATFALNDSLLEGLNHKERDKVISSTLKMTRKSLLNDLELPLGQRRIEISADPSHEKFVMQLRMLLNERGEFSLLTYFGGEADPRTTLQLGLAHALQVVLMCAKQID